MKVLVTGATGFIGQYVIQQLLQEDAIVVVATSVNTDKASSKEWFEQVHYTPFDFATCNFDIVDVYKHLGSPDKIIHLAWAGLPNYKSLHHFEIELPLQYAFLKNLVRNGATDITITGTCFEYGMQEGCLDESLDTKPANPYALAKDTLRKFLQEFQKTHPFNLKWVRLFYMYGKGQNPNSLLSQLEKALNEGQETFNMSGGEQLRDYLPVEIVAKKIIRIALNNNYLGITNCCSGVPISVRKLVENHLITLNKNINLNLGFYPYPDYEPMAFWGNSSNHF